MRMKKRGDRPFQSSGRGRLSADERLRVEGLLAGRGRLSADERLRVEGLLEHVVYRLEGKGSDRFVSFSSMLRRGVTMETVASALMLRRGGKARVHFEDAVSMLGQIARRINSYLLPRIVALRLDLDRQWRSWNGNAPDKAGTRRLVDEFARCHDALFAEVGFLDVRERVRIWPRASGHPADLSGRDEMFFPERGMTEEEATQGSRAAALRNHRREMRTTGFARKVAALTACFERLADDALRGVASARTAGRSPDWQMLVEVLQSFTKLAYCEFSDMDLYFRDDSDPAEDGADVGMDIANEDTEETRAKRRLGREIVRYVDAAIALARRVGSESADGFVLVKAAFERHGGDFCQAEHALAVKADLASFIDALKSSRERLNADVVAKAVRPGRGGARRMFGEDVQEACWHYWEIGRGSPDVAQSMDVSGRKVTHADVFGYYRRELAALRSAPARTASAGKSPSCPRVNACSESNRTKFNSDRLGSRYRSAASRCFNGASIR